MKIFLFFWMLLLLPFFGNGQERGSLLLRNHPKEVTRFLLPDGTIDLETLRVVSHVLTDNTQTTYNDVQLPRRKKAVVRHIKQLNETLERYCFDNQPADSLALELLYELALYEASYLEKAQQESVVTFSEKVRMGWNSVRSRQVLKVKIPGRYYKRMIVTPTDSPFWHQPTDSVPLYKVFDEVAKAKKIKAKKHLVILFDQLSTDGSAPKIDAMDPDLDNGWTLKWGDEVHTDVVGSRIFAALGYDTDHPYYYGKEELTLIFPDTGTVLNSEDLIARIQMIYDLNLKPFVASSGRVNDTMIAEHKGLASFRGMTFVRFTECAVEARPDRVKRLGSFLPESLNNDDRKALRASLLAHQLIGNWDTREANTLLTQIHTGNYHYRVSAVFSDLGTSLGVNRHTLPPDFKTGLVNELEWEAVKRKRKKIVLLQPMNALLSCYTEATYDDLHWMAGKIAQLDSTDLRKIIHKAGWPEAVEELYFHKLASRRHSILAAFDLTDPHPIPFDRHLTITTDGETIVENGVLLKDYTNDHPESLTRKKGRFRNYGNKK